jgi:hypothetical protein
MDALVTHAKALSSTAEEFSETGQQVNTTWQDLSAVYRAPEAGQLLAATAPVQAISASVAEDWEAACAALTSYAIEVKGIQARLEALRAQATALVHSVRGQNDWQSDSHKIDQNNQLINAVDVEVAAFFDAQRRCANTINSLYGGQQYHADNERQARGGYGYTAGQLEAAAHNGQNLPWGTDEQADRGLLGDVGAFFSGIWDGAKQLVTGLGGLIGYPGGQWSLANAGTAWQGLGTFAVAVGVYTQPTGMFLDDTTGVPGFTRGQLGRTLTAAGKTNLAWNEWSKDPARAAGTALFNIVTAVAGTKGAGAALHGVGTAAEASDIATVARIGSVATRGGDLVGQLPTVSDVAGNVLKRIPTLHLPDLHAPGLEIPTEHVDTPLAQHIPETHARTIGGALGDGQSKFPEHTPVPHTHDPVIAAGGSVENIGLHDSAAQPPLDPHHDSIPASPGSANSVAPARVPAHVGAGQDSTPLPNHTPPPSHPGNGGFDEHGPDHSEGHIPGGGGHDRPPITGPDHDDPVGAHHDESTPLDRHPSPGDTGDHGRVPEGLRPVDLENLPRDIPPRPEVHGDPISIDRHVPDEALAARHDLQPRRVYTSPDGSRFYTGDTGRVEWVETSKGVKPDWNPELNHPQPNTTYLVDHRYLFVTEDLGRTAHRDGILGFDHRSDADAADARDLRAHGSQRTAGQPDRQPGDVGSHGFGRKFAGPAERINIDALTRDINSNKTNQFGSVERHWEKLIAENPGTRIRVREWLFYPGDSRRPDTFIVEYTENYEHATNQAPEFLEFDNE